MNRDNKARPRLPHHWSDRKVCLLLSAACRPALRLLACPELKTVLEAAEEYADGHVTADALRSEGERAVAAILRFTNGSAEHELGEAIRRSALFGLHYGPHGPLPGYAGRDANYFMTIVFGYTELLGGFMDGRAYYRDVFDDLTPLPVAFAPDWRTDTVLAIARGIYQGRDFAAMPVLADGLQDAGCDSEELLNHCRTDKLHHRGCWAVDLVLGKG